MMVDILSTFDALDQHRSNRFEKIENKVFGANRLSRTTVGGEFPTLIHGVFEILRPIFW